MSAVPRDVPRREVVCGLLLLGVLGPAAGLLAGCGGEGATGAGTSPTPGGTAGSPAASGSAGAGPSGSPVTLATLADVPVGGGTIVTTESRRVLLVQPTAGTVRAYDPRCPHAGTAVDPPEDGIITCPNHGSQFRPADGAVTRGPARRGLAEVAVTVQGDRIVLA